MERVKWVDTIKEPFDQDSIQVMDLPPQSGRKAELNHREVLHSRKMYEIGRRVQDVFFSLLALVVLSPLLLVVSIAIVIDDPKGGPIFSQDRIGKNGKKFRLYKFRSMCVDAETRLDELLDKNEMDGPVFKIKDDPRITKIGRFIRKTSIDELPQVCNV